MLKALLIPLNCHCPRLLPLLTIFFTLNSSSLLLDLALSAIDTEAWHPIRSTELN